MIASLFLLAATMLEAFVGPKAPLCSDDALSQAFAEHDIIRIPAGEYAFAKPIRVPSNRQLVVDANARFEWSAAAEGPLLEIADGVTNVLIRGGFWCMTRSPEARVVSADGVRLFRLGACAGVRFENLSLDLKLPSSNQADTCPVSAFEFVGAADDVALKDVQIRLYAGTWPRSCVLRAVSGAKVGTVRMEDLKIRGHAPEAYVQTAEGARFEGRLDVVTHLPRETVVHDLREPMSALEPRPQIEWDGYDWYARHESCVKLAQSTNPQVVFIGDSITHYWEVNDERFGNAEARYRHWFGRYGALNLGFGWDRIQNVLWRLDHGEMDGCRPKVVVILIGTNNTSPGYGCPFPANSPEEIADGMLAVCRKVREKAPAARIVLLKVLPRGEKPDHPDRAKVAAVNAALDRKLPSFADERLTVLDLHACYVGADGRISRSLMWDCLHPTARGYDRWGKALRPILEAECTPVDNPTSIDPLTPRTFCNPLPIPDLPKSVYIDCAGKGIPHRQVSDPNLLRDNGCWYLFPSAGFVWESADGGGTWTKLPGGEGLEGHGPGVVRHRGKYYYIPRTDGQIYVADKVNGPYRLVGTIDVRRTPGAPYPADPMLFSDDDGRLYFYWGCTAQGGIWGCELDAENPCKIVSEPVELIPFDPVGQPWEKCVTNPENGWLEGAWMIKLNGRYCLTFSAGGAQYAAYAMGAYWSDRPLGGFRPQKRNPFFLSPKGLVTGTGHGCVVRDETGDLWVSYCIMVGDLHWFERRVGLDRLNLTDDGELEPSTATSEPQFLPTFGRGAPGWKKIPVRTRGPEAADDSLQSVVWMLHALSSLEYEFEHATTVRSFRVCWRENGYDPDHGVNAGPIVYRVSLRRPDGTWTVAYDASANPQDKLVDYRETEPVTATAAKLELLSVPKGISAALADWTLFGN